MTKDEAFKKFIDEYEMEVPEEKVENEYQYIILDMKHRMQYDSLTGGGFHFNIEGELAQQEKELRELAYFEAKSDLVMNELIKDPQFAVTYEELLKEGERIAEEENTSIQALMQFFGENLKGLTRDVQEKKIKEWIFLNSK